MENENIIVGTETSDDAAVYKLSEDVAIINTLDFFTPVVDDPYTFGAIAAANALSDVYAMGGTPTVALNIVCFPNCLDIKVLQEILRGGADKVIEAGAVIIGGHSVDDNEPKYGLSVTGMVHPKKVFKNCGFTEGEVIILTKPLGTGIIAAAIKGDMVSKEAYDSSVKVMETLNKYAFDIIKDYNVSACTDVTGFGLIGHLFEMAEGSNKTVKINKNKVPIIKEAIDYAKIGLIPEGAYKNKKHIEGKYEMKNVEPWLEDILFDPQTSGGLLFSVSFQDSMEIIKKLKKLDMKSSVIGEVTSFKEKYIYVE